MTQLQSDNDALFTQINDKSFNKKQSDPALDIL